MTDNLTPAPDTATRWAGATSGCCAECRRNAALARQGSPFVMDPLPERDATRSNSEQGLYRKFDIRRTDGSDAPGGKHHGCEYFVLDVKHDPLAKAALAAYAAAAQATHPELASDLRERYTLAALPVQDTAPRGNGEACDTPRACGFHGECLAYAKDQLAPPAAQASDCLTCSDVGQGYCAIHREATPASEDRAGKDGERWRFIRAHAIAGAIDLPGGDRLAWDDPESEWDAVCDAAREGGQS